tara:strand:+ start:936 stop:1136 length:201 start_codon:yes stop_codon:yes gene_type:complete
VKSLFLIRKTLPAVSFFLQNSPIFIWGIMVRINAFDLFLWETKLSAENKIGKKQCRVGIVFAKAKT